MVKVTGPFEIVPGVPPKRSVRIYEPARVREAERPLLLMFDGQNVFDDAPSFAGGWHAHSAVERLARTVAPPVVIGVDHGNEHRISELSPFSFGGRDAGLETFLYWITSWLLPKLRREHRLTADPRRVVVAGSSMGGLAALYAALRMPDVFGGAIVMSPSLWIARGAIFPWVRRHASASRARVYLDAGAREAGGRMLAAAERMAEALQQTAPIDLRFRADPRGEHRESDWRRRLLPALRWHFGTSR
jgi:enterochelin esterase-like enzyme